MTVFESIDAGLTNLLGQWSVYSTALATVLVLILSYRVLSAQDPDIHPMLLARQSTASTVRHEGQSAVYRSQIVPHGSGLRAGLDIKDAGAPKWSRGRDGDVRDIWRARGRQANQGTGKLLTVLGSQSVIEHSYDELTRQIGLVGRHMAEQGGIRVAVYLPNSWELVMTLLACSFFPNLTCVLMPYDVSDEELVSMLRRSAADTVVTASGAFPLDRVVEAYPSLRQLVWVVEGASSHLDWSEVPEGAGGSVNVATWQDIVQDTSASAGDLPGTGADGAAAASDVVVFWRNATGGVGDMVRFTQANIVAGVAGQLAGIPAKDRFDASDLFLPADSLAHVHTLTLTLAALYSHSSVALNSVADRAADLEVATRGVAPTVVVASPATLLATHARSAARLAASPAARLAHALARRTLAVEGVFSPANVLSTLSSATRPVVGTTPGKLRLLYVAERANGSPSLHPLSSSPIGADDGSRRGGDERISAEVLSDLRIFTGSRIIYALSAAKVAGAVAQTALYDYRVGKDHFGAPLPSVEIYLRDVGEYKTTDEGAAGEIHVRGPAVAGEEANIGVIGVIGEDETLAYA
ncbi:Acyl-CoA synthetase (AMP-forming)/AMP-acid ligase II [Geosmithia morbida]|uniref:Acyl-CoA synthetase (AMP-forming)/AMP-acid ligase II n=1 Tax=Geosmithia morbida TaxID=1094350 RepID=A0A9P5CYI8_9HYPO|nr:Acyl-CoA synthetase (AMP-forming)/AMP-acid ligase II [Geosmithia morbida]KAF4120483.1 Acyl-CoA synthetase (AMP-forming)/AMP-acid ligase II [Geosmithia morbida]